MNSFLDPRSKPSAILAMQYFICILETVVKGVLACQPVSLSAFPPGSFLACQPVSLLACQQNVSHAWNDQERSPRYL